MDETQPHKHSQSLTSLPTELHLHISSYLSYPDALALKHTSRHFYTLVYTGVHLKVDWFVERFERKLECPMEKCSFRTDEAFCNLRIRRIMERRRRHLECPRRAGGCLVVGGRTCQADLVPSWLKGKGGVGGVLVYGNEVLVLGGFFLGVYLLWAVVSGWFLV
ncbi:F-box domain protein [Aspergillus bombycis]|uniref:F-box domain protein n=1 Tax=Aspergillus bombycis TaxID=109264 RepID=A0A1F8A9T2_9EURO|nr:F-box domain protein [Aspergillus bombycis]OGM48496.1 F-box domain protein [Aspergillus bombycis]